MTRRILPLLIWAWLALTLTAAGCAGTPEAADQPLQRFEFTRLHMGVQTRIVLYAPDQPAAADAARAGFARIADLDAIMSDYRLDSELNRLSATAGEGRWIDLSPDLYDVLAESQRLAEQTGGAFDITVGPWVRLWREARRDGRLPDPDRLAALAPSVGFRLLRLDPARRAARLGAPGMQLDLGGIAKGYAAREAVNLLRARGLSRCLVALAGDLALGDPPPDADGWTIDVPAPGNGPALRLLAANAEVSTSGDSQQFLEVDGVRYSHILDPRTGLGLTAAKQATVITPLGGYADALASAACVLGPDAPARLPLAPGEPRLAILFSADSPALRLVPPEQAVPIRLLEGEPGRVTISALFPAGH